MDSAAQPIYSRRIEADHVVLTSRRRREAESVKPRLARIIPASQVHIEPGKVRLIGGDPDDPTAHEAPAITIEQQDGKILRILVQCPCGRHAELACDHDE